MPPPNRPVPQPQPLLQLLVEQPQLVAVKSLMIVPPCFFIVYCMRMGMSKFHGGEDFISDYFVQVLELRDSVEKEGGIRDVSQRMGNLHYIMKHGRLRLYSLVHEIKKKKKL